MIGRVSRRSVLFSPFAASAAAAAELPDLSTVKADLVTPPMIEGTPAAGKRVRQTAAGYENTDVHHALYLPADWRPRRSYPVIVEYAGNGNYRNQFGDVSNGTVEGSNLGYGMSGGNGCLWISMPYVNAGEKRNQEIWWGDVEATVDYAKRTVEEVCARYGGDRSRVILAGFSRGAIACNYIGLHDDSIASLWRGFVAYSHYDGVRSWNYAGSDRGAALTRLRRLQGRPVFVCDEKGTDQTRDYLLSTGVKAPFTFVPLGFRNHNDAWVLRDIPARRQLRRWLGQTLKKKPQG